MATAFTFGAFGDFVSVVELVVRGLKSLSASSGSSYDYQCLTQELLALRRILQILAAATLTDIEAVTVEGLIAEVEHCHAVVERVWEGIRKYDNALRRAGEGGPAAAAAAAAAARRGVVARFVGGVRAVEWELFKKKDVVAARKKLGGHVGRLNTFVNVCNLSRLNEIWEHDAERSSSIQAVASQVKELTTVMRQRPAQVGYGPANGITFDLFGEKCIFPESFCRSNEQICAIMALMESTPAWPKRLLLRFRMPCSVLNGANLSAALTARKLGVCSGAPMPFVTKEEEDEYSSRDIIALLCLLLRHAGGLGRIAVQRSGKSIQISVAYPDGGRRWPGRGVCCRMEALMPRSASISSRDNWLAPCTAKDPEVAFWGFLTLLSML